MSPNSSQFLHTQEKRLRGRGSGGEKYHVCSSHEKFHNVVLQSPCEIPRVKHLFPVIYSIFPLLRRGGLVVFGRMYFGPAFWVMAFTVLYALCFGAFSYYGVFQREWVPFVATTGLVGFCYGGIFTTVTAFLKKIVHKDKLGLCLGLALMSLAR